MKVRDLIFFNVLLMAPTLVYGACSVANLTRCLDSVCAINIGANPAARCQYCGSSNAGEPTKSAGMKSVSAGASAKYVISDKELKSAPTEPGARYVWGTKLCLEKVAGCTPDDVEEKYDPLIEQSCKAAGISAEMANLTKKANEKKTQNSCSSDITTCVIDAQRCGADYGKCESDADLDKYFAECGVLSSGCEDFLAAIKSELTSARDTSIANADKLLENIINSYKTAREQRLVSAQQSCKNNKAKQDCINRVCASNMRNKCGLKLDTVEVSKEKHDLIKVESTVAEQLCKFYDTACERLK